MPALLHMGIFGTCTHQGLLTVVSADFKVRVKGMPVLTRNDAITIGGCLNTAAPCTKVRWITASRRILASGRPVVLANSMGEGVTAAQTPGGAVTVLASQVAVQGRP